MGLAWRTDLWVYGGVYMDLDFTCLRSLDAVDGFLPAGTVTLGYQFENRNDREAVANAFMAAPPRHPFIREVLNALPYAQKKTRRTHPTEATGVTFLTKAVRSWYAQRREGLQVLPIPLIYTSAWNARHPPCGSGVAQSPRLLDHELDSCARRLNRSAVTTFWTHSWVAQWIADKARLRLPKNGTRINGSA